MVVLLLHMSDTGLFASALTVSLVMVTLLLLGQLPFNTVHVIVFTPFDKPDTLVDTIVALPNVPPAGLTVHKPVSPAFNALAVKSTTPPQMVVCEALTVGLVGVKFVTVMSLLDVQVFLLTVHVNFVALPLGKLLTNEVNDVGSDIVTPPTKVLHTPVP
jgi:hypothetical protein